MDARPDSRKDSPKDNLKNIRDAADDLKFYFSVADRIVMEQGEYDPIEFLMGAGLLEEEEGREWLAGGVGQLQFLLLDDVTGTVPILQEVQTYLLDQDLAKQPIDASLCSRIGGSDALAELCCTRLRPANVQTDLFQDTPLRVAENTIHAALAEHDVGAAREAIDTLLRLHGKASTTSYEQLLAAIEHPNADPISQATLIEHVLQPLAMHCLGRHARSYLAKLWCSTARSLGEIPFSPAAPEAHASYGYGRAGRWSDVVASIEADLDWQQQAVLVLRAAEARAHLGQRESARRTWSLLCWQHPDVAADVLARAPGDPVIARHWRKFVDAEPELSVRDFPAWLLMTDARQRDDVPALLAPEDDVGVVYGAMSRLVSQPHDMDARMLVSQHSPHLLQHYLRRRASAT